MRYRLLLTMILLGLVRAEAGATPNFPGSLQSHLGLTSTPDCTLCHSGATERGTVTTPFGVSLRMRGLVAYDDGSLFAALDALTAEHTDSDKDGVPDIDELKMGTNPNVAPGGSAQVPAPEYGCGVGRPGGCAWPALFLALAAAVRLRRSRCS